MATSPPRDGSPLATERFSVVMSDTDAAGIIYYGAPTRWAERLSTAWFRSIGLPLSSLFAADEGMPAVQLSVTYAGPLRLDDIVEAQLWPGGRSRRSFTLRSTFTREGRPEPAVEVRLTQTFVRRAADGSMRADQLPSTLVAALGER